MPHSIDQYCVCERFCDACLVGWLAVCFEINVENGFAFFLFVCVFDEFHYFVCFPYGLIFDKIRCGCWNYRLLSHFELIVMSICFETFRFECVLDCCITLWSHYLLKTCSSYSVGLRFWLWNSKISDQSSRWVHWLSNALISVYITKFLKRCLVRIDIAWPDFRLKCYSMWSCTNSSLCIYDASQNKTRCSIQTEITLWFVANLNN